MAERKKFGWIPMSKREAAKALSREIPDRMMEDDLEPAGSGGKNLRDIINPEETIRKKIRMPGGGGFVRG